MRRTTRGGRLGGAAGLAVLFCLLSAANALAAADVVHVTRFSKNVNGTVPGFTGSVTVDLLRNATGANGAVVRNQVDTFTAPVGGGGVWSGAFTSHAFASDFDEIEVNYNGTPAQGQVTIGGGDAKFLASATVAPAHVVDAPPDRVDGTLAVQSDGLRMQISACGCDPVSATVNGGPPIAAVAGFVNFGSAVTNADTVAVTGTFTAGGTTVQLTDSAPLLSPQPVDAPSPFLNRRAQPSCDFYMTTREFVCHNLTPGLYAAALKRGGGTVAAQTLSVPSRAANIDLIPSEAASAPFADVRAGDQLKLSVGAHVLSTLTINPFTINRSSPLVDLENDEAIFVTGICTGAQFFSDGEFCPGGPIPALNNLGFEEVTLPFFFGLRAIGLGETLGQLDDTSAGNTQIDMPDMSYTSPRSGESVRTPFTAVALARFNDPGTLVAFQNAAPGVGFVIPPSVPSSAPVTFSVAPFGSSSFVNLGNANRPGGLTISNLAPGTYVGRFTLTDSRGDVNSVDNSFTVSAPASVGPPLPRCRATASRKGFKATISAKRHKSKPKKKKKPTTVTLTVSCSSTVSGARVAVWVEKGSSVVADGSGVVKRGVAKIKLAGTLKRGTYRLIEVIDSGGAANTATHTLKVK
jgi:hypothetical protein